MDSKTTALLIEVLIVPIAKELATRRAVHGVTAENLAALAKNPQKVLNYLNSNHELLRKVVLDFSDAIDNIAGDAVDATVAVFAANTAGGIESNDTGD